MVDAAKNIVTMDKQLEDGVVTQRTKSPRANRTKHILLVLLAVVLLGVLAAAMVLCVTAYGNLKKNKDLEVEVENSLGRRQMADRIRRHADAFAMSDVAEPELYVIPTPTYKKAARFRSLNTWGRTAPPRRH